MSADQLHLATETLHGETETFWKFKCTKVLQLMNLHYKRRARLLLAFGFQHYKGQTLKAKVAQMEIEVRRSVKEGYLTFD